MTTGNEPKATFSRLNWLRAGLLGANDGIVSVAAVTIGVASANPEAQRVILVAGLAALIGGAFSMALGEYVSVGSQRDAQRAAHGGVHDRAHEVSPWAAAFASAVAFLAGGVLPLLTVVLAAPSMKIWLSAVVTVVALGLAGLVSAKLGNAQVLRSVVRVIVGGVLALALTFAVGSLLGTNDFR